MQQKNKGRGVLIFLKNNIGWHLITKFSNVHCQALTVRFKLNDNNVLVTTIYVKPNISNRNFFENIHTYLDNIKLKPKDCHFLCGDLNIDHRKPNRGEKPIKNELEAFDMLFCKQLGYTRETSTSLSCIDVAYCRHVVENSILKTTIGNHYTIVYNSKMDNKLDRKFESN